MNIFKNFDLTPFNTFGLTAKSRYFYPLTDKSDLTELSHLPEFTQNPVLFLGGGSNVIFTQDYPGLIIHLNNKGIRTVAETEENILIEAQAGENWHDFVQFTLSQDYSGLENLSLIPGTVGAAPVQNIGAYGVEAGGCIDSVECFDTQTKQMTRFENKECAFAYRDSIFKSQYPGRYIIVSVCFRLNKHFQPCLQYDPLQQLAQQFSKNTLTPLDIAQEVCRVRQGKLPDPKILGNAGSFFKNPVVDTKTAQKLLQQFPDAVYHTVNEQEIKFAAGWLIDQAGLKGHQLGGAAVHDKQALVLVNKEKACAQDIQNLVQHIQHTVHKKYNITLEIEPVFI